MSETIAVVLLVSSFFEKTWTAIILLSLATPSTLVEVLFPAAIPATCVPWSQPDIEAEQFTPEPDAVDEDTPPGQTLA